MVTAAEYILEKIKSEKLLQRAHNYRTAIGTKTYDLVIVGHSLGAGIASILGILLRNEYPKLKCYCYSPPGGLLSMAAMEYTKTFTISVVLGKDVVPRLGLNQMEALRADLINAIKRSVDPKWKIISCGMLCCCCAIEPTSAVELSAADQAITEYITEKKRSRSNGGVHPSDSTIALTSHQPMYPPGRIIHVVRHHPKKEEKAFAGTEPVYQAIWAENTDFDEVLISPVMIQDHMPDKLLTALNKVIITMGPKKPRRANLSEVLREYQMFNQLNEVVPEHIEPHNICLETCFTTFPDSPYCLPSIINEAPLETTNFRHKPSLTVLDKNKNLNLLRSYSSKTINGAAPLAQPENFSDTSSTASSIHNFEGITKQIEIVPSLSILKTPQMMRRTPRIIGNLNTCSEDIRNVKSFERIIKTSNMLLDDSNSSSNLSHASGGSNKTNCSNDYEHFVGISQCSWQREKEQNVKDWQINNADNTNKNSLLAEELLEEILEYADCADFFKSNSSILDGYDDRLFEKDSDSNTENGFKIPSIKLTKTNTTPSPLILSPCSLEVDPDVISNFAIDLNLDQEHRSLLSQQNLQTSILKATHLEGYSGSHTPPCAKTVTFSPDVLSIDDKSLLQDSSDYFLNKRCNSGIWNVIPFKYFNKRIKETATSLPNLPETNVITISLQTEKRSMDQLLTRNEALPLLNDAKSESNEQTYRSVYTKNTQTVNSEV